MDLMKLLKAKSSHLNMAQTRGESFANEILSDLKLQFDNFLRDVSKLEEFRDNNPLIGVTCLFGEIHLEDDFGVFDKAPYLFLRIPGQPGLLLEPGESDLLTLSIATEARPVQRHWNGSEVSQVVFVRRSQSLNTYKVLERDTVRDTQNSQTLVGTRFFEHLVEQLVVRLSQP